MVYAVKTSSRLLPTQSIIVSRAFSSSAAARAEKLVILGSGWGGYEVLRRVDKKRYDVSVVSPVNYFNFTPLLASAAVGTIEFRCATEAVRRYSPNIDYYQAWADSIDFKNKTLECMPATPPPPFSVEVSGKPTNVASMSSSSPSTSTPPQPAPGKAFQLAYDKLVISVGAYAQTFGIPGVKEHAHFLKDVKDARLIRSRIMECFEQANQPFITDGQRDQLLHFCIVGGGPTGVEFAAELHDLMESDLRKAFPHLVPHARISVYDVAPQILGTFDARLSKYAEQSFTREKIDLKTNHHVEGVEAVINGKLHVKEQGIVPFGLLVWSTGLAPNPLVAAISDMQKDGKTKSLVTDSHLNVIYPDGAASDRDVWAIGDAAKSAGAVLPATAQVASQKAKYVSKVLNVLAKGKSPSKPFEFNNQGALAYLGNMTAIVDRSQASSGPKKSGTGVFAWLFWRSAYITRTVSLRNKFLIMTYWTMTRIFGRDLTKF